MDRYFQFAVQTLVRITRNQSPKHNTAVGLSVLKMIVGN